LTSEYLLAFVGRAESNRALRAVTRETEASEIEHATSPFTASA
jgi:hypothetical protein